MPVASHTKLLNVAENKIDWSTGTQHAGLFVLIQALIQTDWFYCPFPFIRHVHSSDWLWVHNLEEGFLKTGQEERNDIFLLNSQGWTCMLNYIVVLSQWCLSHMTECHVWFQTRVFPTMHSPMEELDSYEAVKDIVIKFLEENVGCFSFFRHAQVQKHGHF